jgi:hypothetical protein
VIHQIGGRLRRAVTRQIVRCGANHHPVRAEVFRHQIIVMDVANTNGQINTFVHQIHHPVSQIQLDPHFRVAL